MLINNFLKLVLVMGFLAVFTNLSLAAETDNITVQQKVASAKKRMQLYKPPSRGAPATRVGGGTRGTAEAGPSLSVLAPDHTGLTISEQPILYWYLSKSTQMPMEITITHDEEINPILEIPLPTPKTAGIHSYNLARNHIKLKPGIEYRWFVALVPDETQRSNDIISGGTIMRVEQDAVIKEKLAAASSVLDKSLALAENGLWYDAINSISSTIKKQDSRDLREIRAAMLEQVGLNEAAEEDLR
jgi:hypothetical protein